MQPYRRNLDVLLLYGYCRHEYNEREQLDNIIDIVLEFYHIPFVLSMLDFNIKESEIKQIKKIYSKQCKGLLHDDSQQNDLWLSLAFGRKNRLSLLTLIIDCFMRDRLKHYYKTKKPLELQKWINYYKILKQIAPKSPSNQDALKSAMHTFFHRYSSVLQLPTTEKYDDSLERFTDFIIEATEFIHSLFNDQISPPFQIELMIIPRNVVQCDTDDDDDDDDDDSDFDDSDFDDDDNTDDEDGDGSRNINLYEMIPKIKEKLDALNIKYQRTKLKGDGLKRKKIFYNMFREMKIRMNGNTNNNKYELGMPHKQRLCIIVDRRRENVELFMFKPDILNEFPTNHVHEWYFESSTKCILPGIGQNDRITAKSNKNGAVFVLSFHCEQKDQLKCYLYSRAQIVRFFAEDIYQLLPELFVIGEGSKNDEFIKSEKTKENKTKKIRLYDKVFDEFRHQTGKRSNN